MSVDMFVDADGPRLAEEQAAPAKTIRRAVEIGKRLAAARKSHLRSKQKQAEEKNKPAVIVVKGAAFDSYPCLISASFLEGTRSCYRNHNRS